MIEKRKIENIMNADSPLQINPAEMTHSIVIVEAGKTDMRGGNVGEVVDDVQGLLNPKYWKLVTRYNQEGRISAHNYLSTLSTPVEAKLIDPVLDKLGVPKDASVFLRGATMSLDGGKTEQQIYALIVFKESEPRLIISVKEPIGPDYGEGKNDIKKGKKEYSAPKRWWKFW